ncbi:hypothetical protein BDN72DRAFT_897572 [Pluteus cervinus]|uniref:Uncharacterized protein n=1 Tax=Pluteus cervinus TaxID=181527 RepID=A0ACD3AUS7_9AGAR|nr:hypothetical protein BDN72DRAFT_897572 [Pluteus cervinus]
MSPHKTSTNLSPFERVPIELLVIIFELFAEDYLLYDSLFEAINFMILLGVCRLWKSVALDTAALWTPFLAFYSSTGTLQVSGKWSRLGGPHTTVPRLFLQLCDPPGGTTRLGSSFGFSGNFGIFGQSFRKSPTDQVVLGLLEGIELRVPKDRDVPDLFDNFPDPSRLRVIKICLEDSRDQSFLRLPFHFPDLTTLEVDGSFSMPEFSALLAYSSRLVRCRLTLLDDGLHNGRYDLKSKSLTHLHITYPRQIPRTYGASSFEKLQDLVVNAKYPILGASYFVGARNSLKRLSLRTSQGGGTTDLLKVLKLCQDLETLELSTALPMNTKVMDAIRIGTIVPELHELECGPSPALRAFISMLWKGLGEELSITADIDYDEAVRETLGQQPPTAFTRVTCNGFPRSLQAEMAGDADSFPYDFTFATSKL